MRFLATALLVCLATLAGSAGDDHGQNMDESLAAYIKTSIKGFDQIPADRRAKLAALAKHVKAAVAAKKKVDLVFICTHNSRRSHLSQIWAQTAAHHYGVEGVTAYSGGTEATAFNPRAVAAIRRAGFRVAKTTEADNPIYHVRYADVAHPITNFSKVYNQAPNPKQDFCAVMTCTSADEACPAGLRRNQAHLDPLRGSEGLRRHRKGSLGVRRTLPPDQHRTAVRLLEGVVRASVACTLSDTDHLVSDTKWSVSPSSCLTPSGRFSTGRCRSWWPSSRWGSSR